MTDFIPYIILLSGSVIALVVLLYVLNIPKWYYQAKNYQRSIRKNVLTPESIERSYREFWIRSSIFIILTILIVAYFARENLMLDIIPSYIVAFFYYLGRT